MRIIQTIKKSAALIIFVAMVIGVFWLMQKKVTDNIMYCTLISILVAIALTFFQSKFIADAIEQSESVNKTKIEVKGLRAQKKRLEEKVHNLTAELKAANLKLKTEISEKPLDQRQLQQRLKNLNCLYALSKIVNRQETPLEQIFQETVNLIRQTYRYPESTCIRLIFDGIRYQTEDFEKSESSRLVPIKAHKEEVGTIEVYQKGDKSENKENPLLIEEEDSLLSAVAEWLESIAERKKAEEKTQLFRNLIERSNDCIFAVEPKWGRFMNVNHRACDSLGYSQKEFLSETTLRNIDESIQDDYAWQKQIEVLRKKGDIVKEAQYKRKDGSLFFVETSLKFVTQGKQDYIIAIARDITERKRSEAKLKAAQEKLLETARKVGMAEVATGVLHNVGNVLNSVSVTAESIQKRIRKSKVSYLSDTIHLFEEHSNDLATFLTTEERGKKLSIFMTNLSQELVEEQTRQLESLGELTKHVQHVADIIQLQQSYSKTKGITEPASIAELIDDAVKINAETISRNKIDVRRSYADLPIMLLDRHKVLQILTNLIGNAIYALAKNSNEEKILSLSVNESGEGRIKIEVRDNGIGIPAQNLTRIFEHGFTTKEKGHGFGLHSTALSVNELSGSIVANSKGDGQGAVFTIELPYKTQETTT
ncbi:MAG: PAS domain S-box protein [Sedimentisphaerales bacterium]|nr:PAS domain S-box protein [Sedimentisphaerales bacterium]